MNIENLSIGVPLRRLSPEQIGHKLAFCFYDKEAQEPVCLVAVLADLSHMGAIQVLPSDETDPRWIDPEEAGLMLGRRLGEEASGRVFLRGVFSIREG